MFQHTVPHLTTRRVKCVSIVTLDQKTVRSGFSPVIQVLKSEELFRGLAVQVDMKA